MQSGFQALLINTVYFKGDWVQPFPIHFTRKGVFKPSADANLNQHDVMYLQGQLEEIPYYEDEQLQMISLAYKTMASSESDISMFVLLPKKEGQLEDVVNGMPFSKFKDIVEHRMENHTVNVKLPKITLQHKTNVKEVMESLRDKKGRRWLRESNSTKTPVDEFYLSRASDNQDFVLTEFVHNVVLEVNEKGTRAAAITGGTINYDGLKKNFRCDHPYLMVIYDKVKEVVLFWAAIYRPN